MTTTLLNSATTASEKTLLSSKATPSLTTAGAISVLSVSTSPEGSPTAVEQRERHPSAGVIRHRNSHHDDMGRGDYTLGAVQNDDELSPMEIEMEPLSSGGSNNGNGGGGGGGGGGLEKFDDEHDHDDESLMMMMVCCPSPHPEGSWQRRLDDFLFPPHLPRSCQMLRPENIAVPACYLLVGLLQGLSSPLVNVLPLDLGATEAQQTTLSSIRSLPASFKLIFGFMSDNLPICGYRRKPYMLLGWACASLSMLTLLTFTNLGDIQPRNSGCFQSSSSSSSSTGDSTNSDNNGSDANSDNAIVHDNAPTPPDDAPSVPFFAVVLLLFGLGFWMADVMGDSIVAEKAKLEPAHSRGSIQSSCYSYRFFGVMIAAPLSTYMYTAWGPRSVVWLLCALPMSILPLIFLLGEVQYAPVRPTVEQCGEIWNTVCSRAVWQPMGFVFLFNLLQVGNSAWREYLVTVLHFTSCELNMILIVAYVLLYLGILAYKYYLIHWSWRQVYILTTCMNGFFSMLQVLLIYGITFGMSPFLFALGDDAFAEFFSGIQFLPTTIMMVHLCPTGSEGASYAMFTTVNNTALNLSSAISTMLLGIWKVDRETLQMGNVSGMINLTYFTTAVQMVGIVFVGWLPRYKEDLAALKEEKFSSSIGGGIFLTITIAGLVYAITVGVLNVVAPGWMGES
jgi:BT1 family